MRDSTTGFVLSVIFQMVGFGAAVSMIGIFMTYRRLRNLARHGVEGGAVSTAQEYAGGGRYRVSYEVRLPEGEPRAEFHEDQPGMVDLGVVVPVVYDRRKPGRGKTGFLKDIDYRADQLAVFVFGYGGVALYAVGIILLIMVKGW